MPNITKQPVKVAARDTFKMVGKTVITDTSIPSAYQNTINILGGKAVLGFTPTSTVDIHKHLMHGIPRVVILGMVDDIDLFRYPTNIEKAFGISQRTFQRMKSEPKKPLSPEQSSRAFKFATILGKAATVFGSLEDAKQWMTEPALGLDNEVPLDLLKTPIGAEAVERFLNQIESGVYV